jgi:hypothetical protein
MKVEDLALLMEHWKVALWANYSDAKRADPLAYC